MDDPKVVLAQLPPCVVPHSAKSKEIRAYWSSTGCAKTLAESHLKEEQRITVVSGWLKKAGLLDYMIGKLLLGFSRPLPLPPSDEERLERRQKALVRMAYNDPIPHLRAVHNAVGERLDGVEDDTMESLAILDAQKECEIASPGTMFAEFTKRVEDQLALHAPKASGNGRFDHVAAE
jgi:hypothetical protein